MRRTCRRAGSMHWVSLLWQCMVSPLLTIYACSQRMRAPEERDSPLSRRSLVPLVERLDPVGGTDTNLRDVPVKRQAWDLKSRAIACNLGIHEVCEIYPMHTMWQGGQHAESRVNGLRYAPVLQVLCLINILRHHTLCDAEHRRQHCQRLERDLLWLSCSWSRVIHHASDATTH